MCFHGFFLLAGFCYSCLVCLAILFFCEVVQSKFSGLYNL
ncbi:hypothetical protein T4D_5383 [Trichinella pseudospiralis]|uniref:Uncharacterized protein n=1 Tax=Trichinella pseudospiralis TaxID=6337 RepID=A0A0V1DSV0_TRIPS|nr:hypothetical protein T4D_5383 [Trichinella pseudospiralis]